MTKDINIHDLFDFTRTDKKGYTKILNCPIIENPVTKGTKNKTVYHRPIGKIVMMSPLVALKRSYAKTDVSKEQIRHPQFKPSSFKIKWGVPFIDTLRKVGFGRGRMILCASWGIKQIPVLIVARNESAIDKWVGTTKAVKAPPAPEVKKAEEPKKAKPKAVKDGKKDKKKSK